MHTNVEKQKQNHKLTASKQWIYKSKLLFLNSKCKNYFSKQILVKFRCWYLYPISFLKGSCLHNIVSSNISNFTMILSVCLQKRFQFKSILQLWITSFNYKIRCMYRFCASKIFGSSVHAMKTFFNHVSRSGCSICIQHLSKDKNIL